MDNEEEVNIAYELVNSDKYEEALIHIKNIRLQGCIDEELTLYEALCAYELKGDIECLRLLSLFLRKTENIDRRDYALFTAGICLMNLGLATEAIEVFSKVNDSYPNIDKERKSALTKTETQKKGLELYNEIRKIKS